MIGTNEMGPVNLGEIVMASFFLLFSSLLNAQIFGEMAVVITILQKK